jgi:hypothetical protein
MPKTEFLAGELHPTYYKASKAKVAMAHSYWHVSGFIRFASSRVIASASLWLVSKIIWFALNGPYKVVDHTRL